MNKDELAAANEALRAAVVARLAASGQASTEAGPSGPEAGCGAIAGVAAAAPMLPGTRAFMAVLEEMKALHLSKTQDYGDSSAGDALANIRNGSDMVGIEHWKGALVRAADKMQRLKTYCRVGRLVHEGVDDTLLDLAAYAVLALVLFREATGRET